MHENLKLMQKMVKDRYTYGEIGKVLGITKQRVHQVLKNYSTVPWNRNKTLAYGIYRALLNSPCGACGSRKKLEVHHIDGNRNNNAISNLIRFCRSHHMEMEKELFHNGIKKWNYSNREKTSKVVNGNTMRKDAIWFKGGEATKKKYGIDHYQRMGMLSGVARKRKKKKAEMEAVEHPS